MKNLLLLIVLLASCAKEDPIISPENVTQSVTYTCYCKSGKAYIKYVANDMKWYADTFVTTYKKTVQVRKEDFHFDTQLINVGRLTKDSLSLNAESNGKKASHNLSFGKYEANASLQLLYNLK